MFLWRRRTKHLGSLNTPSMSYPSFCFPGSVCTLFFGHSPRNGPNITASPGQYVLHHVSQTILLHKFLVVFMLGLGRDSHMSCWEERNFIPRNSTLYSQLPAKPLGQLKYLRFSTRILFKLYLPTPNKAEVLCQFCNSDLKLLETSLCNHTCSDVLMPCDSPVQVS